jgi:hypothetical protein
MQQQARRRRASIQCVANHLKARMRQLRSNLMLSTCLEREQNQGASSMPLFDRVVGDGALTSASDDTRSLALHRLQMTVESTRIWK